MKVGNRRTVRIVFAFVLALFFLQLPLIYVTNTEPYPALTMPAFAGHPGQDGFVAFEEAIATVKFADGETEEVDIDRILPESRIISEPIFRKQFGTVESINDPETAAWLEDRLQRLYDDRRISALNVMWVTSYYDVRELAEPRRVPLRTFDLDFEGAG